MGRQSTKGLPVPRSKKVELAYLVKTGVEGGQGLWDQPAQTRKEPRGLRTLSSSRVNRKDQKYSKDTGRVEKSPVNKGKANAAGKKPASTRVPGSSSGGRKTRSKKETSKEDGSELETEDSESDVEPPVKKGKPNSNAGGSVSSRGNRMAQSKKEESEEDVNFEKGIHIAKLSRWSSNRKRNANRTVVAKGKGRASSHNRQTTSRKKKTSDTSYEVHSIIDERIKGGVQEYKVRWKNYKLSAATWEPSRNLSCDQMLNDFKKKRAEVKKKTQKKNSQNMARQPRMQLSTGARPALVMGKRARKIN